MIGGVQLLDLTSRIASCLVAFGYLIAAFLAGGWSTAGMAILFLILPLGCIWLPDELGSLAFVKGIPLDETPGWLVVLGGWILLLLPLALHIFVGDNPR